MRSFLPGRRGAGGAIMLVAIVGVGLFSARLARQQAPTPFQLFQRMMPVIRHPRCSNCHGGVDPTTKQHPGAPITVEACVQCHDDDANPGWGVPAREHFFVGKTDEEVCSLFAEFAMKQGHGRFIDNHLRTDELIVAGFKGLIGGARTPGAGNPPAPPADPPPVSQDSFVKLGQDWIDKGQGACEVLGAITLQESVAAGDTFAIGGMDTYQDFKGTRTVSINIRGGKYYADIKTDYTITEIGVQKLVSPKTGRPCTITHTRKEQQSGTTTGIASVAIKDTIFFADTKPPQTDYRIDVTLPPETTRKTETRTVNEACGLGIPFPPSSESQSFTWGRASFVIEGHVEDPKTDGRAGACDRPSRNLEINTTALEFDRSLPCFRFKNMGNSWYLGLMERTLPLTYHDVTRAIPYHLVARWNLKYTK